MRKFLFPILAAILVTVAMAPAPASAVDFSVFGSWVDLQGGDDSWGGGVRISAFDFFDHLEVQLSGTYYDSFNQRIFGSGLVNTYFNTIEVLPIDLGGVWYFDADNVGFYAGGGITYFNLKTDIGKFDDDTGFFVQAGWQFRELGLWVEGIYREGDAKLTDLPFPDEITTDFPVDIANFGVNVGWRF
jgi:hypothetical protein